MRTFMDEVTFEDEGRTVVLCKKCLQELDDDSDD